MTRHKNHKLISTVTSKDVLVYLFLIVTTIVVYWPIHSHEFLNYDDDVYVTENAYVQKGLTQKSIAWAFTSTVSGHWHPLTWLSHMTDVHIFGMNPGWHHTVGLLFHILNTLLLFIALNRMTGNLWCSAAVSALFAIHPMHVESVAWIAERKDVLSTFFWMLTMWCYIRYVEQPGKKRYALILISFILGLMAKPMLVTLPIVLLLLDYWPFQRFQFGQSSQGVKQNKAYLHLIWEKLPLFIIVVISSIITIFAGHSGGALRSLVTYSFGVRIENALVSYIKYIAKLFWPSNLAVFYPHHGVSPNWMVGGAFLLLVTISVLAIKLVQRHPFVLIGWLWYLVTLLPVIGLLQMGGQAMADRYSYISYIGLFIIIVWAVSDLLNQWQHKKLAIGMLALVSGIALMATSWLQVGYWKNNLSLFGRALEVTKNNHVAHNNYGSVLLQMGKKDEAFKHFSEAVRIEPNWATSRFNLGNSLKDRGSIKEAIYQYSAAVKINPAFAKAHNNLAFLLAEKNRYAEAIDHYNMALRINPEYVNAYNNLGNALFSIGKPEEAIRNYSEALRWDPNFAEAHQNLGSAYIRLGNIEKAIFHFRKALQIKPNDEVTETNLQKALAIKHEIDADIEKIKKAIEHDPTNHDLHLELGDLFSLKADWGKAAVQYQKALSIQPSSQHALNNLAIAYARQGEYDRALAIFKELVKLQPDYPGTYYNLASVYAIQNEKKESIDWLKQAIARGYQNWDLIKNDPDLENIRSTSEYKELIKDH